MTPCREAADGRAAHGGAATYTTPPSPTPDPTAMPHDTTMPIPEASTSDHAASIVVGTSTGLLAMGAWIGTMLDRIAGAILITLVSTLMTAAVSYIAKGIPQMVIRLKFENARLRNRLAAAESANAKKDGA